MRGLNHILIQESIKIAKDAIQQKEDIASHVW